MKMKKNIVLGMAGVMLLSGMAVEMPGMQLQELIPIVKARWSCGYGKRSCQYYDKRK